MSSSASVLRNNNWTKYSVCLSDGMYPSIYSSLVLVQTKVYKRHLKLTKP